MIETNHTVSGETIASRIYLIRGQKVMLENDLAQLYGVQTKRLKEQVKRNLSRFPPHFMFELTKAENEILRSQIATLRHGAHSKYLPYAFTEHGILMLSNILKSEHAIAVSIRIIDIFVKLRQEIAERTDLWLEIEKIKSKIDNQDKNMEVVFQYLDELIDKQRMPPPRTRIGYKPDELK